MTRTLNVAFYSFLIGFILFAAGCSGFVTASSSYVQDGLPTDDDGNPAFLGYVPSASGQVRMQARGATNQPWTTIQTVNATSSPTYADGPFGPVRGYSWVVRYAVGQLVNVRQGDSLDVWIRFVTRDSQNNDVTLLSSSGDLNACYFGARRQGTSAYEAAEGCFTSSEIRVHLNPPDGPPPDPPECPPEFPDCHVPIVGPGWDSEGMGGGNSAP